MFGCIIIGVSAAAGRLIIWGFPQVDDYTLQINELHTLFRKRSSDFGMIQDGMKQMKEFEKTKAQMEQELSDVRVDISLQVCWGVHWLSLFMFGRLETPRRLQRRNTGRTSTLWSSNSSRRRWHQGSDQPDAEVASQTYPVLSTLPQARLEREAEEQVALVVERAHSEAVLWEDFLSSPLICTLSVSKNVKKKIMYSQKPLCMEGQIENKS